MKQLSGLPSLPTLNYGASDGTGLDGEGRIMKVNAASGQNPVSAVTYSSSDGTLGGVTYGSGDFDTFTYDTNTLRLASYGSTVGSPAQTASGTLTWNANGSLQQLAISDPFNAANSQTCNYQHDDLGRTSNVNCGGAWQQAFGFDVFGNLTKTGSQNFTPTYSLVSNHINGGGYSTTYDANGNQRHAVHQRQLTSARAVDNLCVVRFADRTAIHFNLRPRIDIEPELFDWKTGDGEVLKEYAVIHEREY